MKIDLPNEQSSQLAEQNTSFSIKEFLIKYFHYTWLFVLSVAICIFCGWLYLRYTTPKYRVSATLIIRNDNNRGKQDMFSDLMLYQEGTNKQNEIQILRSRKLMTRVVQKLGLQYSYYVVGNVKTTNIYREAPFEIQLIPPIDNTGSLYLTIHLTGPTTFRIGENAQEYHFGQIINVGLNKVRLIQRESSYSTLDYKQFIVRRDQEEVAALTALNGLDISGADDISNVLRLTYVTENPRLGADIINTLMDEYSNAGVEDKNLINRKILGFIDDRLKFVEKQLDSVERDLQVYKTDRQVIDLGAQSKVYLDNMTTTTKNIQEQDIQLQVVGLLENYLRDSSGNLGLVPSTLGITDNTLQEFTASYNKLVIEREKQLQTGATLNSPIVKSLDKDINESREKLLRNLANIKATYKGTLNALQSQNSELKNQLASVPQKERESRERARQQEIKQNLYLYLLQKKEESGIAQASVIADSKVIDDALSAGNRVSPNAVRIYTMVLFIGLVIPVVIIYILDLLNDKVTTKADILRVTNVPIVAEVGHSSEENALLFPNKSRTVVAEQIRIMRSNLRFLLPDKPDKNTILVTSSFSGEGKSFISINLAAALALSGKKTVLLEFDLRKPKVLAGLGLPKGDGLTNYLVGSGSLPQLVTPVPAVDNLFVIPSGPIPPNPSEILLSDKMPGLFAWLSENFDAIVIDTAPVGLVSDSMTLSQYADVSLYIIRQRYTYKKQLQFIQDLYELKKLPRMGLVINDVLSVGARNYYGYGGGRYGYGYGYGYGAKNNNGYYESERKGFLKKWKKKSTAK